MSIGIRRLNPTTDQALYRWAFGWLAGSPEWRRHTEAVFGTLDRREYLQAARNDRRIDIGVVDGPLFVAKVALHLIAKHTYEVSLEAMRGADKDVIAQAGCLIRDQLFGVYGAQCVFAWVPRWARGVQHILLAIGFHNTHATMLKGTCRGRVIEWLRFSIEVQQ